MDYKKLIETRKSVREYKKDNVPTEVIEQVLAYGYASKKLIPEIEFEILVKSHQQVYGRLVNVAGYQGNMIEAPHYILILSQNKPHHIKNTGYLGEDLALKLHQLEVASCWVTFPDSDTIKQKLEIETELEVTAIIAFGYEQSGKKFIHLPKIGGNYKQPKLEEFKDTSARLGVLEITYLGDWGNPVEYEYLENRMLIEPLYYARLAPSTLNRQPWKFIIDEDKLILTIKDDANTNRYEEEIDAGIQMLYFDLVMAETLIDITWRLEQPARKYNIPSDYQIVGYCTL